MPDTVVGVELERLADDRVGALRVVLHHLDAVEPAVHEVAHGLGRLVDDVLPRDQACRR